MEVVDKSSGEILQISNGGLYSPFPIPAYDALGNAGEHKAQVLLSCLVSFMGKGTKKVWPSYSTIVQRCGISRALIKKNLDVLEDFGFINVTRGYTSGVKRKGNIYRICESAYDVNKFNLVARDYAVANYFCKSCGNQINKGEIRKGPLGDIHLGCGGQTFAMKGKRIRNKSLNNVSARARV